MKLVFETNNPNKLAEIRMLVPSSIEFLSLKDINCHEELPETSDTLEDNAAQKAFYVFDNYGYNCFADDTGLEIDILDGSTSSGLSLLSVSVPPTAPNSSYSNLKS